jgi:hypothetical protein
MLLSRWTSIVLLSFSLLVLPFEVSAQENVGTSKRVGQDSRPANCRVTLPSDGVFEPPSLVSVWPADSDEGDQYSERIVISVPGLM